MMRWHENFSRTSFEDNADHEHSEHFYEFTGCSIVFSLKHAL